MIPSCLLDLFETLSNVYRARRRGLAPVPAVWRQRRRGLRGPFQVPDGEVRQRVRLHLHGVVGVHGLDGPAHRPDRRRQLLADVLPVRDNSPLLLGLFFFA